MKTDPSKSFLTSLFGPRKIIFLGATLAMVLCVILLPSFNLYGTNKDLSAEVHLALELISVIGSVLVVLVIFHRLDKSLSTLTNSLVFGFTLIAILDLIHAMTFTSMPPLFTENSTEKTIFFWLIARFAEMVTFATIAFRVYLRGEPLRWLLLAIVISVVFFIWGTYFLEYFPVTFVQGQGVTLFKTVIEYGFVLGNLFLSGALYSRYVRGHNAFDLYFSAAAYCMGLCSFTLATYISTSDFNLLVAHGLKILAAVFVYYAIFMTSMRKPFDALKISEESLRQKELELETLFDNMPIGILRVDRQLVIKSANPSAIELLGLEGREVIERSLLSFLSASAANAFGRSISAVWQSGSVDFQFEDETSEGIEYRDVIALRDYGQPKDVSSFDSIALCFISDTTEKTVHQLKAMAALKDLEDFKAALDFHAIMAVTDRRGVILQVNDKFCDISQYTREELIGNTHKLINSGEHEPEFFRQLWKTIGRGKTWHGEICNRAKDGSLYWVDSSIFPLMDDSGKPYRYLAIRADITQQKQAEEEAERLAKFDQVTLLPNRSSLIERIRQSQRSSNVIHFHFKALILIDFDGFRVINETIGYSKADMVLKQAAARLTQLCQSNEFITRIGADEFALFIPDLNSSITIASEFVGSRADQIRDALSQTYFVPNKSIECTVCQGVYLFSDIDESAEDILAKVDIARDTAKQHGSSTIRFFDPETQLWLQQRSDRLQRLKTSLSLGGFHLYYQPIFNRHQTTLGVEALIRWQELPGKWVPPDKFIPLAEESNMIVDIGNWVIETACQQLVAWANEPLTSSWFIAINVSARQIIEKGFVKNFMAIVSDTGAQPEKIHLEITESLLQYDLTTTIDVMVDLQRNGIHFSLDDFGTGYSSLSYLTMLPIRTLKIDRSFVDKMLHSSHDDAVVQTILSMAQSLKLTVVAEGIETQPQLDKLIELHCDSFQGYLFCKPMPSDELVASLKG